jgi:hypothetical protein
MALPLSALQLPPDVIAKLGSANVTTTDDLLRPGLGDDSLLHNPPASLDSEQLGKIRNALAGALQAPAAAVKNPGGRSLVILSLVALGLLIILLAGSLATIFLQNGQYTSQQLFLICVVFAFVAAVSIFALFSVASLRAEIGGQVVVQGVPLQFQLAGSAGAFIIFYLLLWLLAPPPAIRTVYLTVAAAKYTAPSYELRYRRGKLGANLAAGTLNVPLTITDIPATSKSIEVDSVSAVGLWPDKQANKEQTPWTYPIDADGYVRIEMVVHDSWPDSLNSADVKQWVDEKKMSRATILAAPKPGRSKESVSLAIVNATDRPLWIEAFDCTRLFDGPDTLANDIAQSHRSFPTIREFNTRNAALGFKEPENIRKWAPALDMFRNPSGWVAFYTVYKDHMTAELKRSRVCICNVFEFPRSRLTITLAAASDRIFDGELSSDD